MLDRLVLEIIVVCISLVCIQRCDLSKKETIHFNKFLPNSIIGGTPYYTFDTLLKVDVQRCIKACQRTEVCKYINYEKRYLRCSLLRRNENIDDGETSSSVVLETKPGQIFGNKSEWKKVNLLNCDHCEQNRDCEKKMETKTSFCKRSACDRPKNSDVKGNMFTPGSKIVYNCNNGFTKIPRKVQSNKATCLNNGTWDTRFVCLKGVEFNGSFYHVNTQNLTWYDAKDYCQNVFGHLVDIESEDEQWFLSSLFDGKYSNTWTGGNDLELTGTYVWSDGTEMTYTYWNYKQPDYSDQHCVEIVHRLNEGRTGGWEDENCLSKGGSVCEIP